MAIDFVIDEKLEDHQILWRYMDLSKFVSMLDQKGLWLARADTFRDRHEGCFPDEMRKIIENAYKGLGDDDKSPVKDAEDFQDYLIKNTFINCWHKNLDENFVMWEIYGRDDNTVAIQTTVGRLRENIDLSSLNGYSLLLKNVIYKRADEILGVLRYEECFFIKRPHFSFEEEVRISLDTYSRYNPVKNTAYGHKLPANINGLVEKILVHPESPDWFLDVVSSIAKKYGVYANVSRGVFGTR